jgi:hypothetical protein
MNGLSIRFENGTTVNVDRGEAHRLIDLLWTASAFRGSLFAIRTLQRGLAQRQSPLAVTDVEAGAIGAALHRTKDLPPTLARLDEAIG